MEVFLISRSLRRPLRPCWALAVTPGGPCDGYFGRSGGSNTSERLQAMKKRYRCRRTCSQCAGHRVGLFGAGAPKSASKAFRHRLAHSRSPEVVLLIPGMKSLEVDEKSLM